MTVSPELMEALSQRLAAGEPLPPESLLLPTPDLAELLNALEPAQGAVVLAALPRKLAVEIADEEDFDRLADLLAHLDQTVATRIVAEMAPDQRADVLQDLPEDLLARILAELPPVERAEAQELLDYPEDSAGGLMTTEFTSVRPQWTVAEAMQHIRQVASAKETIYPLYVTETSHRGKLIGVLSLRELLVTAPETRIAAIMTHRTISVPIQAEREEVARAIARYNLLAVPVLDPEGRCRGIVTVDDVIDVIVDQQTEAYLRFGAVANVDPIAAQRFPILTAVRSRIGWLLVLFLAETLTGLALRRSEATFVQEGLLDTYAALTLYLPLLIGTGGNAGSQTVSTVIRGLALKEIGKGQRRHVMAREIGTGLVLGVIMGVAAFARAHWGWGSPLPIAEAVGLALIAICAWACFVGAAIPLLADRYNIDPAVLSAPLITTLVDATGLVIYFSVAWSILH